MSKKQEIKNKEIENLNNINLLKNLEQKIKDNFIKFENEKNY